MPPHVSTLRVLDFALAALYGASAIVTLVLAIVSWILGGPALAGSGPWAPPDLPPWWFAVFLGVVFGIVFVIFVALAILALFAGRALSRGGRGLQTAVAILALSNFPVGTAFGIYSLWVCFSDEASRAFFERANLGRPD